MIGNSRVEKRVEGVHGPEITLLQREVVNDARDLPMQATMDRFFAMHPEWAGAAPVDTPFHWKWCHAFQQVGDSAAAALSKRYTQERPERHRLTRSVALLSPAVTVQLALQHFEGTDTPANIAYEAGMRKCHAELRRF